MTTRAILTGHTRGLGAAIAEDLLSLGIDVLGISRGSNTALARKYPMLQEVQLDLADCSKVTEWIASDGLSRFATGARMLALINNAGIVHPVAPIGRQDSCMIASAIAVNVTAPLMLANAIAAIGTEGIDKRILHVSSGAARSPYSGWSIYCATKAALDHHARAVAQDAIPGLRICSLAPGIIDTDMQAEIRATPLQRFPLKEKFEELKRTGQLTDPKDCARNLVRYLVDSSFGDSTVADLRDMRS